MFELNGKKSWEAWKNDLSGLPGYDLDGNITDPEKALQTRIDLGSGEAAPTEQNSTPANEVPTSQSTPEVRQPSIIDLSDSEQDELTALYVKANAKEALSDSEMARFNELRIKGGFPIKEIAALDKLADEVKQSSIDDLTPEEREELEYYEDKFRSSKAFYSDEMDRHQILRKKAGLE